MNNEARQNNDLARQREQLDQLSTVLIRSGVAFVKRHYVLTSMYIFGVALVLFATGVSVTADQEIAYNKIINTIDDKKMIKAQQRVYEWETEYHATKGWFSCDEVCEEAKANLVAAKRDVDELEKEFAQTMSKAKQEVGIFSEYGVQEARDLFWAQFAGGKQFAQRSSWYDLIFMSIGSMGRDESLLEFALRFLIQMLLNFTIGLIGALIGFYWYLWSIVASYQPSFLLALGFFVLASIAATSFVATFLIGLYGASAGSVYAAAKLGSASVGRNINDGARRQAFLQQQRSHYD
mmetsp:Transcript_14495/g.25982  ORF Transcript_14495/g.25982 Transcript_14495/m.25982 type:complete len:293 (+) Transcript_14495:265-1143(+)|eukprot:CAMPEP_0184540980 /NCGR_PEP_ID=MMETSP0199_2-20130426/1070_1 /TAXON_ID=1112570 /ORGANISM="Thraustochytrium sp., Strain LLF1b" /LENGTH=292 /DNA_ID=CAMNT_0026934657 /DNA_START=228 /DNA_END=1106 /DNA_ORIENTATION=+